MSKTAGWGWVSLTLIAGVVAAQAQTAIPPSPKDFAITAAESDQYEILAATVATIQGQDPKVRSFAEEMIRDHTRLADGLRQAAAASGLPRSAPAVSADQAGLLSSLQSLRGVEFDKAYAQQQVLAHTQAVAVEDSFATDGADANLKTAAQSALPVIQDHLKKARQLRVDLGGA